MTKPRIIVSGAPRPPFASSAALPDHLVWFSPPAQTLPRPNSEPAQPTQTPYKPHNSPRPPQPPAASF
jgi:hypothetical protein